MLWCRWILSRLVLITLQHFLINWALFFLPLHYLAANIHYLFVFCWNCVETKVYSNVLVLSMWFSNSVDLDFWCIDFFPMIVQHSDWSQNSLGLRMEPSVTMNIKNAQFFRWTTSALDVSEWKCIRCYIHRPEKYNKFLIGLLNSIKTFPIIFFLVVFQTMVLYGNWTLWNTHITISINQYGLSLQERKSINFIPLLKVNVSILN